MPIKQYINTKTIVKNNADTADFIDTINISSPFLVKRIRFNFAYNYRLDTAGAILVYAKINSYNRLVGVFNQFIRQSGGIFYARDMNDDTATEIIFNDPIQIHEDVQLTFVCNSVNVLFNLNNSAILSKVECYSE